MDPNQKWFYLSTSIATIFGLYIAADLMIKKNKKKRKNKQQLQQTRSLIQTPVKMIRKLSGVESIKSLQQINRKKALKVVFTGGPCAGKTTAMAFSAELLRDRGFKVFMIPEAATQIAQGGGMIDISSYDDEEKIMFQSFLMKMQINFEDEFTYIANIKDCEKPSILLCDRGVMDGSAYIDDRNWQVLIDEMGFNAVQLRDNRYDAVIHMVTAANGAEKYYNLDNKARYETDHQQAIETDNKLIQAWNCHPYWISIDNSTDFHQKVQRVGEAIMQLIGEPSSLTFYKKFLLKNKRINYDPKLNLQTFQIEDTFLAESPEFLERRIRRRGQNDSFLYLYFETKLKNEKPIELKRRIKSRDFIQLYQIKDRNRKTILKYKTTFIWENITLNIEEYIIQDQSFIQCIVQTEQTEEKTIRLPSFIKEMIVKEITDDPSFTILQISREDWVNPYYQDIT